MSKASTGKIKADDGLTLFYRRWPGTADQPVLLFVHGMGEHSGRYRHPVKYFSERGYTLYAYDQRGHGRSGGRRVYSARFANFLGDLNRIVRFVRKRESGKKIFLVGHSFGGQVVLSYGARYGDGLDGVIASSPNIRLALQVPFLKKQAALLLSRAVPILAMASGIDPEGISHDPAEVAAYAEDPLVNPKITARLASEMMHNQEQLPQLAQQFRLPCLLMHGGEDPISDPEGTEDFYHACISADKSLKIYPGCYHELFNEVDKAKVFQDMQAWIRKRT